MVARKFTRSKDGVERCEVRVTLRLSREELAELEECAALQGEPLSVYLLECLHDGLLVDERRRDQDAESFA